MAEAVKAGLKGGCPVFGSETVPAGGLFSSVNISVRFIFIGNIKKISEARGFRIPVVRGRELLTGVNLGGLGR